MFEKIFKRKPVHAEPEPEYYEDILDPRGGARLLTGKLDMLVVADTHGELWMDKYLRESVKGVTCDVCMILGDVHDYDLQVLLEVVPKEKIVALLGNHDRFSLLSEYGLTDLNGRMTETGGFRICGMQGSFRYKDEDFPSFDHEESIAFAKSLPECDILISHDGPFVRDNHSKVHDGLKGITRYLYENRVPLNIHGHNHHSSLTNLRNGTLVKEVYQVEHLLLEDGDIYEI
ncbi:MAG: metallophosphoesterase family protein [Eubacteriaceae bacterium]|nr:metallophosphoesterase family protein [Eubacteriaceae bacterium]